MRFWFFSPATHHRRRLPRPAPSVRPLLEPLEDRCLPAAMNTVASLSHDQIHILQDQSQQQTTMATIRLEVEQIVLGLVQPLAAQTPQVAPLIAGLTAAIPMQQATVQRLQQQTDLLNQLDDLQDQSLILGAVIQNATPVVGVLEQLGDVQTANALRNTIQMDEAAMQALQPQIAAAEVAVSAFV